MLGLTFALLAFGKHHTVTLRKNESSGTPRCSWTRRKPYPNPHKGGPDHQFLLF